MEKQPVREQTAKDQTTKEQTAKEQATKDQTAKDQLVEGQLDLAAIDSATRGRYDLYGPAHKLLRHIHVVMLPRLARADWAVDQAPLLADLRQHLTLNLQHLTEEDKFIHPLMEQRAPGSTARLAQQHEAHRKSYARIEEMMGGIAESRGEAAAALGRHLYLAVTTYVGDDMIHMFEEEERTWPLMCKVMTDEEIIQMEQSILANYGRDALMYLMPHLAGGASLKELVERMGAMKKALPPADYSAIADGAVRKELDAEGVARLCKEGLLSPDQAGSTKKS